MHQLIIWSKNLEFVACGEGHVLQKELLELHHSRNEMTEES